MDFQVISFIITVVTGVVSVVLAVFAIWLAKSSERESQANFERTQNTMRDYYEKTKDVLAEIDKRATVTERSVTDSQRQLLDTVTNLLNETVVPAKPDFGEQMMAEFLQNMMKEPAKANEFMAVLQSLAEISHAPHNQGPKQLPKSQKTPGRRKS